VLLPVRLELIAPHRTKAPFAIGNDRDDGVGARDVNEEMLKVARADAGGGARGGQPEAVVYWRGVRLGLTDIDEARERACA
jgi:hypothetical protein